jgi:putative ABC transport system permease protein
MRRAVASSYAVAVGVVGAVLGAAVGFIPGIAVSYPLTRNFTGQPGPSHYLDIPWLEILGLVVGLPLLVALVVGLLARSRLPLVARLD